MSKELIERLRMMSADTIGNDTADALEIATAGMNAYSDELGRCRKAAGFGSADDPMAQEGFDAFGDPLCVAAFVESQFKRIVSERDALAASIRDAAVKAGICRNDAPPTGPILIMLCGNMADSIIALAAELAAANSFYARDIGIRDKEISVLREKTMARFANEDCWIFQGDGNDHLESLVCPVVIMPTVLGAIIKGRDALAAELKALREREPVAWFSYSADAGFSEFKTFQEAINSSRDELNEYRNEAVHDGEWPEEVAFIKFGAILGRTTELKGETDSEGWVDFQLTQSVPARELTDEVIGKIYIKEARHIEHATRREIAFARAIERYLKGEGK